MMKKLINRMLVASFISVGLAGCTQDKNVNEIVPEGEPTTLELKLKFSPNTGTRATTADANAIPEEAELKTIDVFIYTDAGDFLELVQLSAQNNEFTQLPSVAGADVWETSVEIPVTTGVKNFYVGANLPASVAASLQHQPLSIVPTAIQNIARDEIDIANGLPMFGTVLITKNLQPDAAQNEIIAEVKRIVAKVTVEVPSGLVPEGTPGTLGDLEWVINNQNSKYFLLQGSAPNFADPNWSSYTDTDFSAASIGDYKPVNKRGDSSIAIGDYQALYALENTSFSKATKELTRVTVRATFIPEQWVVDYLPDSDDVSTQVNTNDAPADFCVVSPTVGQHVFFKDFDDATTYATEKGVTVNIFTGGYCYWNIFLNKDARGDVLRNDFYQCNITRIVAPGANSDRLTNPDGLPTEDSSISVAVNVLNWNTPQLDDYELVP